MVSEDELAAVRQCGSAAALAIDLALHELEYATANLAECLATLRHAAAQLREAEKRLAYLVGRDNGPAAPAGRDR